MNAHRTINKTSRLVFALAFSILAFAPLLVLAAESEFQPLFNGKTLDGWVNINCHPETWSVRDGMIYCTGKPIGELRTERMYQNFVLELEWQHLKPKGNAGVFVWADAITAPGQPFHRGVEVQVLDGREAAGHTSDGDIFPIHGATLVPDNGRGGMRAFPTEKRSNPSPEWNHYKITCNDGAIQLEVNGKQVTSGSQSSLRKGYICLESEGSPVNFRNLRIRELPDTPLKPDQIAKSDEGFVSLYNGVDLAGWKTHEGLVGHWSVNDWRLAYDGKATGQDKHLWTEKAYQDFELIVDWRWNGKYERTKPRPVVLPSGDNALNDDGSAKTIEVPIADSGILLRGTNQQVNIWQWPIGSGELWSVRNNKKLSPEIRAAATPSQPADKPVGQWNRYRIKLVGDRITVNLNGTTVIDDCQMPGLPESGSIGLQHHGDPIEFANIFVREM